MRRIKQNYTIRESVIKSLREFAHDTGFTLSHIVDIAIEYYIDSKKDPFPDTNHYGRGPGGFRPVNAAETKGEV